MSYGTGAQLSKDKNIILWTGLAIAVFLPFMPMSVMSPLLILLFGVATGIIVISIFAPDDFNFLSNVYFAGFGIRVFLAFFFYILSFILRGDFSPGFLFDNDGWPYSQQGWEICKFAGRGIKVTMDTFMRDPNMRIWGSSGNITAYDFFASHIYSITGYSPLSLFFISSLAGSIAGLFIYLIANKLFSKNVARISACFAFFWPSFIMWSTQNLKESMIAMFVFILLWAIFSMRSHHYAPFLFLCLTCLWVLFKINFTMFFIVILSIFFAGLFLFTSRLLKGRFAAVVVMSILAVLAIIFLKGSVISFISNKSKYNIASYNSIFDFLQYHRDVRAYGNLQFFKGANISSPFRVIFFAPLGLLYAIFAPFPWQLGNIMQIMAVPETILFYALFPSTVKGVIFAFKKRFGQSLLILSIVSFGLFFLALVEGNSGTLFRHRAVIFYLILIFTAVGMTLKNET